ncbi:MAG: diguanylate cyclase [Nitrosomonadales bacterium]|nr:diguanylate cyclase [Nitrosomonadales bacterium]
MFDWLLSRPLQLKFFFSTLMLAGISLLALMLSALQVINPFLSRHIGQDMQDRTYILASTLMVGPAAHDQADLRRLLRDVTKMQGYCYLTVQDTAGKLLASAGNTAAASPGGGSGLPDNNCHAGSVPLVHDGQPFGTLRYGVDLSFAETLKASLYSELFFLALLWLAIGAAMYFLLVRSLVKPLREITLASESMAHGNLNAVMPTGLPQDELGKLAASFGKMAAALRERIETQQRYAHDVYTEQARLNALISILPVGVMFVDPARRVQYINLECRRLWGLPESEDYIGQPDSALLAHARHLIAQPDEFALQVEGVLKEYGATAPFDTRLLNNSIVRSRSCVVPDAAAERYIGRMWMFEDVSEEHMKLQEAQLRADRDVLTGLYNRRRFQNDAERMFAQAHRNNRRLSLLYFDLDDFKGVNDAYGHAAGDSILKGIAQILSLQSRRNEELYRVGGDEFAILVADAERFQIEALARRVIATVEKLQFGFGGQEVHVRCSMGIATCSPKDIQDSAADLMQQADIAMYQAKHFGKNRWHFFDPEQPLDLGKDSR